MLNANSKKTISVLITLALFLVASCSSPEEKRTKSLARAAELKAVGDTVTALELLEILSQNYPDDSEILKQIGLIHQELHNHTEAAFYLAAAQTLSPDDSELLYQTYLASENANQPEAARELLEVFAKTNPTAMTDALWFRLGELQRQAQKTESALEAYLEGIKLLSKEPSAEIALAIGTLFKQLNNLPMAERWLTIAAKSNDPNALFGLLEIHLRSKNWEAAEKSIAVLDEKFPGAVDASKWANSRIELKEWRAAQAEMNTELKRMAKAKKKAHVESIKAQDRPAAVEQRLPQTSGKAQVVTDIATAEAFASKPANETSSGKYNEPPTTQPEPEIVFDPSIDIQPAEPDTGLYKPDDLNSQGTQPPSDDFTGEPGSATQSGPISETVSTASSLVDSAPLSLEELIIIAEAATSKHDYEKAIQFYWDALGQTNKRADIWNALSKVYLIDGQSKNAMTTALEATRLNPDNIDYTLDYLRVARRVKKPADFIKELEMAYERFPQNPEITLSLARGYRRISGNNYAAVALYKRFIQIAPDHPLRREAETELASIPES